MIQLILDFKKKLPKITGNKDYQTQVDLFVRIGELIKLSGLDWILFKHLMAQKRKDPTISKKTLNEVSYRTKVLNQAKMILRTINAKNILRESYRGFAVRMADSPMLQQFCLIDNGFNPTLHIPSKSTLQTWETIIPKEIIDKMNDILLLASTETRIDRLGIKESRLKLESELELKDCYLDTTCLEANIHYPVDWLLLRDAVRSLTLSIIQVRKYGISNRMTAPKTFMTEMNKYCIAVSQAINSRKEGSRKQKKTIIREMISILKKVGKHAEKHLSLLNEQWQEAGMHEGTKDQIVKKIENVLNQLAAIIYQVRERVIGERIIDNDKKILSLHESEAKVIVRKKSGSKTEFGNTLAIMEQMDGLITAYKLYQTKVPSDCKEVLPDMLEMYSNSFPEHPMKSLTGDRGFDSKDSKKVLGNIGYNICHRNVKKLAAAMTEDNFANKQRRRASTEARIHIVKNIFYDEPVRAKGFENRERRVAWAVLAHNLWKLARLPRIQDYQCDLEFAA